MGVKSTKDLTRAEAEQKYIELRLQAIKRRLCAEATSMSDSDLEDVLVSLNDAASGGEGFEDYSITQ